MGDPARRLIDRVEAAEYCGVCERTFIRHAADLPAVRIGRRLLYDMEDLDAWIDSRKSLTGHGKTNAPARSRSDSRTAASDTTSARAKQILDAQRKRRMRSMRK